MKKIVASAALLGFSLLSTATFASEFNLPGFVTEVEDGRLWVFKEGSPELEEFKQHGEPAKQFSNIGAGPNGMTIKAANQETLDEFLAEAKKK